MSTNSTFPKTLVEAVKYFSDPDTALNFLVSMRWPDGVRCPRCESDKVTFTKGRRVWTCAGCPGGRRQFSIKVNTIMEDSPIPLDKWLVAMWLIVSAKNGISSYELHRALGITQKSAWFLAHRIRLALQNGSFEKMTGQVEADETYIGAKSRFMHSNKRREKIKGTGGMSKTAVMGLLERATDTKPSRVVLKVVDAVKKADLQKPIRECVEKWSEVYTDALMSYSGLSREYTHEVIDHAVAYVRGHVHTNGLENFWSLLKRSLRGTYVNVEPFHLFRYLDEQAYRFNERKGTDSDRFLKAASTIVGRRLTYAGLTGNLLPA